MIVVISGLGGWAWYLRAEAQRQTQTAKQKTREVLQVGAASMLNSGHFAIEYEHDLRRALVWYGQAALTAESGSDQHRAARDLIGSWGRSLPVHSLLHDGQVVNAVFSPDGSMLATASLDKTARLWDVATGKPRSEPLRHEGHVNSIAFSPDGSTLATASWGNATASWGNSVKLWDVATGKTRGEPLQHEANVNSIAFSADGSTLATASGDLFNLGDARLWDVATGKQRGEPLRHEAVVNSVAFSPDGSTLATASDDMTVRLLDVSAVKPRGEPLRHEGVVNSVAFSPDGSILATGSHVPVRSRNGSGVVRLWDVATGSKGAPTSTACGDRRGLSN